MKKLLLLTIFMVPNILFGAHKVEINLPNGKSLSAELEGDEVLVKQMLPGGIVDTIFADNGTLALTQHGFNVKNIAIGLQDDGKIVLNLHGDHVIKTIELNSDGTILNTTEQKVG